MTVSQSIGLLRCRVGGEAYGFEMSAVVGVIHVSSMLRPVAAAPREPVGWVASPNEPDVPVYRLADCLHHECSQTESGQHVVVVRSSLGPQGYLVDSVSRELSIPAEQVHACPELLNDPARRLFNSVVLVRESGHDDSLILVLSPERLHRDAVPLLTNSHSPTAISSEHSGNRRADSAPPAMRCETNSDRIILFPLANSRIDGYELLCGLSIAQVVEILEPLPINSIPFAPPQVAGFVMWRGQALPVLQLSRRLGVVDAATTSRMMIVRHGQEFLALLTSQSMRARRLPLPHQPCLPPNGLDSAAILGTFQSESEVLIVPNLSQLTRPQSLGV